ncbi:MAG: hypothetical protein AAF216_06540 [Pseudomonadota bacterium]
MLRLILLTLPCTLIAAGLMYAMAAMNGIDPLAPEVRTIAWVTLLAATYVGFRIAMVINRYLNRSTEAEDNGAGPSTRGKAGASFKGWGRSSSLDARMEARRRRVEAAKANPGDADKD